MAFDFNALSAPFSPSKVHWRVGQKSKDGTKGMVLAYLDARDVMERLDEVCGPDKWECRYEETPSGRVLCTIGIYTGDDKFSYIEKSDGAGETSFEGAKGAISDALKRAAVCWGIGRYLYDVKAQWVDLDNGYLPRNFDGSQYLTAFSSKQLKTKYYKALKAAAAEDDSLKAKETWHEMDSEQQLEIWEELKHSSGVRSTLKKLLDEE